MTLRPKSDVLAEIKKSYDWEKPKRIALTIEEQSAFVDFMATHTVYRRWLPLMTVLLGTGCRVGEIIGLRWDDCDFDDNTISINHNTLYRHYVDEGEMRFHITTPKTKAGRRTIPMLSDVKKALLTEYNIQLDFGFCDEEVDGYTGFIFQNRYGGLLSPHDINRAIDRICNAYNKEETEKAVQENRKPLLIRHFSVHNLRHTFCTRFCENETNLKVIQEIMGHAIAAISFRSCPKAFVQERAHPVAVIGGNCATT